MEDLIEILLKQDNIVLNSFARALKYSEKLEDKAKEKEINE